MRDSRFGLDIQRDAQVADQRVGDSYASSALSAVSLRISECRYGDYQCTVTPCR